jgi:hypothetical protein
MHVAHMMSSLHKPLHRYCTVLFALCSVRLFGLHRLSDQLWWADTMCASCITLPKRFWSLLVRPPRYTVTSDCGFTPAGSNIKSGRCASKGPAHFLLVANQSNCLFGASQSALTRSRKVGLRSICLQPV